MTTSSAINTSVLHPYGSFGILQYVGQDETRALGELGAFLRQVCLRKHGSRTLELKAEGLTDGWAGSIGLANDAQLDADAFIYEHSKPPGWANADSDFMNIVNNLVVTLRRDRLVAVHCPADRVDALQRWLDKEPRPGFRRVPAIALEQAILRGEAKGLWLRGTHPRQTTKADAKNLSGSELRDALDPFDDSSFALSSGRSAVPDDPRLIALRGTVGTTPRKSWVWNAPTDSFRQFVDVALELLTLVGQAIHEGTIDGVFPELATVVDSLHAVATAYDAYFAEPDEVRQLPGASDDLVERAETMQGTVIEVIGDASASFTLVVGDDEAESGRLRCRPVLNDGHVAFNVGVTGSPSNPARFAEIRDAAGAGELLSVFYASGHAISLGTIAQQRREHAPFRRWRFHDFAGYDIDQEKPAESDPQSIHDAIGRKGDKSLFAWVARHYRSGHLTCDDSANEVADFVHLTRSGDLTLVHVKGAGSGSSQRRCSAGAFELVVSQASKNSRYLSVSRLRAALETSPLRPATWSGGRRRSDRSALLAALDARPANANSTVVIIQPHHFRSHHERLQAEIARGIDNLEIRRLQLIETMLNSARGSITGLGADLEVFGAI